MLNADPAQGAQDQDQEKFGIGDWSFHAEKYPYIGEFSEFLFSLSTKAIKYTLMTYQQRLLAKALWEAENYGGSKDKCAQRLKEIYGPAWNKITTISENFTEERAYCEYVLILDHIKQWDKHKKLATLRETSKS